MNKKIKTFLSPTFKNEIRKIIILEPENITANTPVLFFFDGQILKLNEQNFNQFHGIEILKIAKKIGKFIIIAVNSMNSNSIFKYKKRVKELINYDKLGNYLFFNKVKEEILILKKKYQGFWFGFGFSLSGFLVGINKKIFDQTILVSPYFGQKQFKLPQNTIVFYGKKEYKLWSKQKINQPIEKIKKLNEKINFFELKDMKHTFGSWNKHFYFIIKNSITMILNSKVSKRKN